MREFFWIISLLTIFLSSNFLDRFQALKYFRKNSANTDEVHIQYTTFLFLFFSPELVTS